ncbi:MAG TPA: polysaccharide deacetylase family protein [Acidimicrobiales bacterium]|nr:polysaccharide deacetylase family protein [Acidimicrobiales bacterium]
MALNGTGGTTVGAPTVTLTFDNGPVAGVTDHVLDVLADAGAPAVFFVVGDCVARPGGADLVRRALAEGHRVGSHTATHTQLLGLAADPAGAVAAEMAGPATVVGALGGEERLHRPYAAGGVLDRRVLNQQAVDHMVARRWTCALWTCVPHDWDDPDGWADRALAHVEVTPWSVIVLHDVAAAPVAHLPRVLAALAERGARLSADLPAAVTPIRDGEVVADLSALLPVPSTLEETQ